MANGRTTVDLDGMQSMRSGHSTMHQTMGGLLANFGAHIDTVGGAWSGAAASIGVPALQAVHESGRKLHAIQGEILERTQRTAADQAETHQNTVQEASQLGGIAQAPGLAGL